MKVRKAIPIEVLREVKILNDKGHSITEIARNLGYHRNRLVNNLDAAGIEFNSQPGRGYKKNEYEVDLMGALKRTKKIYENPLASIRNRFEVGNKVDVSNRLEKEGQCYRITGRAIITGKYKDFILIEKKSVEGIIRECISYAEIHSGQVRVAVVEC